jgi:hypothetical protein
MPRSKARVPFCRALCALLVLAACHEAAAPSQVARAPEAIPDSKAAPPTPGFGRLSRPDFNRRAVEQDLPLFWRADANADGTLQPGELGNTWRPEPRPRAALVDGRGEFTAAFSALYAQLLAASDPPGLTPSEHERRESVRLELAQGRATLVDSDFSKASSGEKKLVGHLLRVAASIETLYAKQKGTAELASKIAPEDPASRALFFRNQGPECVAPRTEHDPHCHALPDIIKPAFGLYPASLQSDKGFCEQLGKQQNAGALRGHFSVVVSTNASPPTYAAVPYSKAFDEMPEVARELRAAAADLGSEEPALQAYLRAAAQGFETDDWEPANRAWVEMGSSTSKYYLRVGPDEVYFEPCAWKAGFALAFARINPDSLTWRKRLEPIKQELEDDLARLAGKPYRARRVAFKLPDFIDIVLNAGDNRSPIGATVGQSLPNWGPVAEHGGRTVTMTNLYTDADSQQALRDQMSSLYCKATLAQASADPEPAVMGIVLHEAAHNLGPAHEYAVGGKVDSVIFGGPLASTLEELKAQSAALYLGSELARRQLIEPAEARVSELREVAWIFGHISEGMYDAQGKPKNYSQLAAIQLGSLSAGGAVEWKPNERAGNGSDVGCFDVHFEHWEAAATELLRTVLQIKGRGDKAAAEALKARFVDGEDDFKQLREMIAQRWLRSPKSSFVYSITGLDD